MLINFFGAPGSGKSTLAYKLCGYLKGLGKDVEFAPEYIKTLIALGEHSYTGLELAAMQFKQIMAFEKSSQIVITDSPVLLPSIYSTINREFSEEYRQALSLMCFSLHNLFKNRRDILVTPILPELYQENLRFQKYEESKKIYHSYFENLIEFDLVVDYTWEAQTLVEALSSSCSLF